jgi:hypothetical protein
VRLPDPAADHAITVSNVDRLPRGSHRGNIKVTPVDAHRTARSFPITMNVTDAAFRVAESSLAFQVRKGEPGPPPQTLHVLGDMCKVRWSAARDVPWIRVSPAAGETSSNVAVSVETSGLDVGSHAGSIVFAFGETRRITVPVTLTVTAGGVAVLSFAANPSTISAGQSSMLSWDTAGATSASISGVSGVQPVRGSLLVSPAVTTTYTLTASGPAGTATAAATVTVQATGDAVLTGTWAGDWTRRTGGSAIETDRLTWNLIQTGTSVTGTYVRTILACDGFCPDPIGFTASGNLFDGNISAGRLTIWTEGGTPFSCTITPPTMPCTNSLAFPGNVTFVKQ